jgi:hypothetical protein
MDEKKQKLEIANDIVNAFGDGKCKECMWYDSVAIAHAEALYNAGYRKQEWISVKERLPDTTLKRLIICDQDIGSGEVVNEEDGGMVQMSAIVAVISRRCTGGEVKQFFDFDQTIDGVWAHNMSVTHWMPLPEAPKMKGGAE